jgi:hypothetical protein
LAQRRPRRFESLESRDMLAVFTVTNTASSGAGSLWQAITDSNAAGGPNTVQFDLGSGGPQVIRLTGFQVGSHVQDRLPDITSPVTIDGTTQPGFSGSPLIELDGQNFVTWGLTIDAPNCTIRGLDLVRCKWPYSDARAIVLGSTASNTTIADCIFGTDASGASGLNNNVNLGYGTPPSNLTLHGNYFATEQSNFVPINGGVPVTGVPNVSASTSGGQTTVTGNFTGIADTFYTIRFFDNTQANTQLGSTSVTTDGSGKTTINKVLSTALPAGDSISATATDANGNSYGPAGDIQIVSPNALYVTGVYHDVLGRDPDSGGLAYWSKLLGTGTPVNAVAKAIAHSAEYYANFVIRPGYLKLLGRQADDAGVTHWTQEMLNGLTDQELEAGFVASIEFFNNAGGTNTAWIDSIYRLLLGRDVDPTGQQYWNDQLMAGGSRSDVAVRIADSAENETQLVNSDYQHYLGRAADAAGVAYWLAQLAAGRTNEDIISGFTGSEEYYREQTGVAPNGGGTTQSPYAGNYRGSFSGTGTDALGNTYPVLGDVVLSVFGDGQISVEQPGSGTGQVEDTGAITALSVGGGSTLGARYQFQGVFHINQFTGVTTASGNWTSTASGAVTASGTWQVQRQ